MQNLNLTFEQVYFVLSKTVCFLPPPRCSLEKMIEALLLMLRETDMSDVIPSFIQVFENITGSLVKVTQAENGRSELDCSCFATNH